MSGYHLSTSEMSTLCRHIIVDHQSDRNRTEAAMKTPDNPAAIAANSLNIPESWIAPKLSPPAKLVWGHMMLGLGDIVSHREFIENHEIFKNFHDIFLQSYYMFFMRLVICLNFRKICETIFG